MKITFNVHDLKKKLAILNRVIEQRPLQAFLSNILLHIDKDSSFLFAMNEELSIRCPIDNRSDTLIRVQIPSVLLTNFINNLNIDSVTLEIIPGGIKLQAKNTRTTIKTLDGTSYPIPDSILYKDIFKNTFQYNEIKTLFANITIGIDANKSQHVLRGVHLYRKNNILRSVGTDGVKFYSSYVENTGSDTSICIFPKVTIEKLLTIAHEEKTNITISVSEKSATFDINGTVITTRLIPGDYPNVSMVVDSTYEKYFEVDRKELLTLLKQVSSLTSKDGFKINILINNGKLLLSTGDNSLGSFDAEIDTETNMDYLSINLNSLLLQNGLSLSNGDTIKIYNSTTPPGVLTRNSNDSIYFLTAMR